MLTKLKFSKSEPSDLEVEIARVLKVMSAMPPTGKEYAEVVDQFVKIQKLQTEIDSKKRVSSDAMVNAATNLVGIVVVLKHEWAHVIGSKAFNLIKSIR